MGIKQSKQFSWEEGNEYRIIEKNLNDGTYTIVKQDNHHEFIGRQLICKGKQQQKDIRRLITEKTDNTNKYLTKLVTVTESEEQEYCYAKKIFYLLFEKPGHSLREEILTRKFSNQKFSEQEAYIILQAGIKGLRLLRDIAQPHSNISSSSFFISSEREVVLGDPWITPPYVYSTSGNSGTPSSLQLQNISACPSPQKIQFQNDQILEYCLHRSDLFSLGTVILEVLHFEHMDILYQKGFRKLIEERVKQKIDSVKDPHLRDKLKVLLAYEPRDRDMSYTWFRQNQKNSMTHSQARRRQLNKIASQIKKQPSDSTHTSKVAPNKDNQMKQHQQMVNNRSPSFKPGLNYDPRALSNKYGSEQRNTVPQSILNRYSNNHSIQKPYNKYQTNKTDTHLPDINYRKTQFQPENKYPSYNTYQNRNTYNQNTNIPQNAHKNAYQNVRNTYQNTNRNVSQSKAQNYKYQQMKNYPSTLSKYQQDFPPTTLPITSTKQSQYKYIPYTPSAPYTPSIPYSTPTPTFIPQYMKYKDSTYKTSQQNKIQTKWEQKGKIFPKMQVTIPQIDQSKSSYKEEQHRVNISTNYPNQELETSNQVQGSKGQKKYENSQVYNINNNSTDEKADNTDHIQIYYQESKNKNNAGDISPTKINNTPLQLQAVKQNKFATNQRKQQEKNTKNEKESFLSKINEPMKFHEKTPVQSLDFESKQQSVLLSRGNNILGANRSLSQNSDKHFLESIINQSQNIHHTPVYTNVTNYSLPSQILKGQQTPDRRPNKKKYNSTIRQVSESSYQDSERVSNNLNNNMNSLSSNVVSQPTSSGSGNNPVRSENNAVSIPNSLNNANKNVSNDNENNNSQYVYTEQEYDTGTYKGHKNPQTNMREGKGKFAYKEGSVYDGEWKDNMMDGKGTLYYANGTTAYEGEWKMDQFHGTGNVYNMDQANSKQKNHESLNFKDLGKINDHWVFYGGELSQDRRHGKGKLKFDNGQIFVGVFSQDIAEGQGKFYTLNGEIVHGIWKDNKLAKLL